MTVRKALQNTRLLLRPGKALPVEVTSTALLSDILHSQAQVSSDRRLSSEKGVFRLSTLQNATLATEGIVAKAPEEKPWAYICIRADGSGTLMVSHPALLYAYTTRLVEDFVDLPLSTFEAGKYYAAAFRWHRPLYDYLLTQVWRTARQFDPEEHIREMARAGYTHVEVNGMAVAEPFEESVPGEFYAPFYAHCPALDQFVDSELNKGIYPAEYLKANLSLLKRYSRLARTYGLEPGILCFEPRSVPEKLLRKYPTLRGARVDHPFRSRKPRYTLAVAHPLVQEHYREMMRKLLRAVPDLAYMSIWSNDSGAGFEHTASLYAGRNGGPYLIREWRTPERIAEAAGQNIVHFMKTLRDAAAEINPDFRVSLRLEAFEAEQDVIVKSLENKLDIEVPSLLIRGYNSPYTHDKYPDLKGVAGTVHHTHLRAQEKAHIQKLERQGVFSHLMYSHGNGFSFEPLSGIPFPWLLWQKLRAMFDTGVNYGANLGGFTPSRFAPYHINQEVFRTFMLEPMADMEKVVMRKAVAWAGEEAAEVLVKIWRKAEEAIRWLPPLPLYSSFGFVWLRLWVRPIIPDLLAVPDRDRRYYEDLMVSPANNTNLTDLGRDVLFRLITQATGEAYVQKVDANVGAPLEEAIFLATEKARGGASRRVFVDQRDRLLALRCWTRTLRSVAGWCAGVYGYLNATDATMKKNWRDYLDDVIGKEIQNARDLLELWQTSDVAFMFVSGSAETCFIYGENFGELVKRKIELMGKYRNVEPRIDGDMIWKV